MWLTGVLRFSKSPKICVEMLRGRAAWAQVLQPKAVSWCHDSKQFLLQYGPLSHWHESQSIYRPHMLKHESELLTNQSAVLEGDEYCGFPLLRDDKPPIIDMVEMGWNHQTRFDVLSGATKIRVVGRVPNMWENPNTFGGIIIKKLITNKSSNLIQMISKFEVFTGRWHLRNWTNSQVWHKVSRPQQKITNYQSWSRLVYSPRFFAIGKTNMAITKNKTFWNLLAINPIRNLQASWNFSVRVVKAWFPSPVCHERLKPRCNLHHPVVLQKQNGCWLLMVPKKIISQPGPETMPQQTEHLHETAHQLKPNARQLKPKNLWREHVFQAFHALLP